MGIRKKLLREEKPIRNTRAYLKNRKAGYKVDAPPIFVTGCGHSGTTIMLRLLGAHSKIHWIPYETRILFRSKFQQCLAFWLWNRSAVTNRKHRWVEKTPLHVRIVERAFETLPDARVIFMVRDGRDATVSMRKRYGNFERGLKRWVDDNRFALQWMDDKRVMILKYEDLVKNSEQVLSHICDFIGEKFEEEMLSYHERSERASPKEHNPASEPAGNTWKLRGWQISQKLYDGSGRWKEEMTEEEKALFKKEASDLLIQFGYAENNDW